MNRRAFLQGLLASSSAIALTGVSVLPEIIGIDYGTGDASALWSYGGEGTAQLTTWTAKTFEEILADMRELLSFTQKLQIERSEELYKQFLAMTKPSNTDYEGPRPIDLYLG